MPLKNLFTSFIIISSMSVISSAQDNTAGTSGNNIAESMSGTSSKVLIIKEDLNSNGNQEVLSASMIKKIDSKSYWVYNGNIEENSNGKSNILLSLQDKIVNTDGIGLINQVTAKFGYLVRFSKNLNGVLLISIADKNGNSASDELQLKWNKEKNKFEILNN